MPVDRNEVKIIGPFEAMASSDQHTASLLIWNRDPYRRRIDVHLNNIPFSKGDVRIFRIDTLHASWGDGGEENLIPVETFENVDLTTWSWLDKIIPEFGIIYIEADDRSGRSELDQVTVGNVLKVNRYYPDRGTTSYSDFDRKRWIARFGMGKEELADQEVGVLASELPDVINVRVTVDGRLQRIDKNSLFGIRIDYQVDGVYISSVLYHGPIDGVDLYSKKRTALFPWGTGRKADKVISIGNFSNFPIALKANAPAGWTGKAHIAMIMQNAGKGVRAKVSLF
jgi:hypothetical protein